MAVSRDFIEQVKIRFEGQLADENLIPLEDLTTSLDGWKRFFDLTAATFFQGRLSATPLPPDRRIQVRVRTIRPGSIEAALEFVGYSVAAGILGNTGFRAVEILVARLWKWRRELYEAQVKTKRRRVTVEEAAAALQVLSRDYDIAVTANDDPFVFVERLDESLRQATVPIGDQVASRISVVSDVADSPITATLSERRAIELPYAAVTQPQITSDVIETDVRFERLNVKTGSGAVVFEHPTEDDQTGIKTCAIVDARVHRPRDPYTKAMHERQPIRVYARKKVFNQDTGAVRWELSADRSVFSLPLFEES